jgi:hypothetical protein
MQKMYFIDFPINIITGVEEVDINTLKCHEEVVVNRLNSLINYLQTLEGDILISSIIVCDKTHMIVDGHHRYHALKKFGIKRIPVTFINYDSSYVKAYFDDRILKNEIINKINQGLLFSPKSSKHVVWDSRKRKYMPILMLSSMWSFNLNEVNKKG